MSEKKAYPLRINAEILAAAQRWADDELRSVNAQIEYLLSDALRRAGRGAPARAPTRPYRPRPPAPAGEPGDAGGVAEDSAAPDPPRS